MTTTKQKKPLTEKQLDSLRKLEQRTCVGGGGKGVRCILWAHADSLVDRGLAEPAGMVTTKVEIGPKGTLATQVQSFRITDAGRALLSTP
jgi:hypothetical protein